MITEERRGSKVGGVIPRWRAWNEPFILRAFGVHSVGSHPGPSLYSFGSNAGCQYGVFALVGSSSTAFSPPRVPDLVFSRGLPPGQLGH